MNLHRTLAWAGKELREMVWLVAMLGLFVAAVGLAGTRIEAEGAVAQRVALLTVAALVVVVALILAQRQSQDLGSGTRRHVLSFPLRPSEVIVGKMLAAMAGSTAIVLTGVVAAVATSGVFLGGLQTPGAVALWVARVVLLASVPWSLELAADSWPRVGLAGVLSLVAAYSLALVLSPALLRHFNVLLLVPAEVSGRALAGAVLAGGTLAGAGLVLAGVGLHSRNVE